MKKTSALPILLPLLILSGCTGNTPEPTTINANLSVEITENANTNALSENTNTNQETETVIENKTLMSEPTLYRGKWFDVTYPSNFTAFPTTPQGSFQSPQADKETVFVDTDEATFSSPDKNVEFFVFSPQWGGDPIYLEVGSNEELVSEKTENDEINPEKITKWATIKAKDGSYTRSYVSIQEAINIHKVFGIKYKDQASYDMYKDAYTAFKNSLTQYSD